MCVGGCGAGEVTERIDEENDGTLRKDLVCRLVVAGAEKFRCIFGIMSSRFFGEKIVAYDGEARGL